MNNTVSVLVVIEPHTCGECGVVFGMDADFVASRRRDGKNFYCPNGHCRVFRETDLQIARKELQRERDRNARLLADNDQKRAKIKHLESSRAAYKGQLAKTKKRVAAGVCPCCNRTFQDLARHMKGQHPDYAGVDESAD